jgi:hypothetical protein
VTLQERCNNNILKRILEKSRLKNQMSCDLMRRKPEVKILSNS